MEIRIRHIDEAKAVPMADFPFDRLDSVIPIIKGWGIAEHEDAKFSGRIVVDEEIAYFEVIIISGEDHA